MPTPNAWHVAKAPPKPSDTIYPGLNSGAKSHYEEIQNDELIALSSIYGDDFKTVDSGGGAWQKSEPCFQISVKSSIDDEIHLILKVTLVATYPRSAPLLSIIDDENLRDVTKYKLQNILRNKPKDFTEEPMIMEIVDSLREILDEAAAAKAAGMELPSLEEERAIHEATAAQLAQEQEAEDGKKKQQENKDQENMLKTMVEEELKRQRAKAKEAKRKSKPPTFHKELTLEENPEDQRERLIFEQPSTIIDEDGIPRLFQAVVLYRQLRKGPIATCFTAKPIIKGHSGHQILAVKQVELNSLEESSGNFKSMLRTLEADLETLKKSHHANILDLFDYKVEKSSENLGDSDILWTVSILTEFAEKGSLQELLDISGSVDVEKVRAWTIELLDALRYIHDRGIVHQDLHAGNIMLVRSHNGVVTAKIADAGFQRQLHALKGVPTSSKLSLARSAYWLPPENSNTNRPHYTQKTDIWDFGIVFLQMIFGLSVFQKYASPDRLTEALDLSEPLNEILRKFFKADPKKRPRSFELSASEFLATDASIMMEEFPVFDSRGGSISSSLVPPTSGRQRRESQHTSGPLSRWKFDFTEVSRLGKGGFGEVVKARKKLDGQFYAIKTITQNSSTSLTEILKEVRLLSQISHPYVVRYYNTWTEEIMDTSETDEGNTTSSFDESSSVLSPGEIPGPIIEFDTATTGGLDFISSSGYPQIEFGYASGDDDSTEDDDDEDGDDEDEDDSKEGGDGTPSHSNGIINDKNKRVAGLALRRTRSDTRSQRSTKTILYIQMEYCERRTLRDLIKRGLYKDDDEIWRLFRQMLEGMAHIHNLNVVHRDLKPENIFIDGASNVRIGDFGLATAGQYASIDKSIPGLQSAHNMTTSIGTASYVAPEVRSAVGTYNSKVDMYSLGVMLFEMCYPPVVGMERATVLQGLRQSKPVLPSDFNMNERSVQAEIILSLVDHNPKIRPASAALLQSGLMPVQMESETIRQTLAGLSDPKSPYYEKMMAALFSRPTTQAKDFAWDMDISMPTSNEYMLRNIVKQQLVAIFKRHGALETPRASLFPRSGHYGPSAVQLLDPSGTLVQLPYDLTLPYARSIAKQSPSCSRSFAFGSVFRDKPGGQPISFGEVDFDIVSDSLDLALKEAEVIKVLDEIIDGFPSLAATQMCFHINHSDLLNIVFDFCRVDFLVRPAVAEVLSKLNIQQWTWQKIRNELRSPSIGMSAISLDDLQRFDFRDTPVKAFSRLKTIFEGTEYFEKAAPVMAHMTEVIDFLNLMDVHTKLYINPLSSLKESFYKGGILFSCLYDRKQKDVFAAGGRYDSLVQEYRPKIGSQSEDRHVVGFSLAWERLSTSMARYQKTSSKTFLKKADEELQGVWTSRRCDVLIASFDAAVLRSTGVEILQRLWTNEISAELAVDTRSPEDLLSKYRDDQHYWIIIIKQDSILKIKSMSRKDIQDVDIPITQLMSWLNGEMREREHREGNPQSQRSKLLRHSSHADGAGGSGLSHEHEQEVRVLVAQTKSKKSNRRNIVEQAHGRAASLVSSFLDGPIAAIETSDYVMELIRDTRLSDGDSWRKVSQSVPTTERRYIGEIHDMLKGMALHNKDTTRNSFIYNFRTGLCIYYDLGA